ncbi:MAG: hypothetical protein AAGF28_01980 [Pseudomonadota bacterium]
MTYSDSFRRTLPAIILICSVSLSGCAAAVVTGAVVGTAATATKLAVKGTVGAGKLAYKGTKATVGAASNMVRRDDDIVGDDLDDGFGQAIDADPNAQTGEQDFVQ